MTSGTSEARWLQKVLFAVNGAREARQKLAEAAGDELNPLVTLGGGTHWIERSSRGG